MARNTRIENPTRVAIATVEDQNKYQMARNRNIDQTNQYMETNVGVDINVEGKSNLMRLADSLREANPAIQEYLQRKEKQQEIEDTATASQDFLTKKPKSMEEANAQSEGKSLAYKKAYAAMSGNIFANESKNAILEKFIKSPDKENVNIRDLVSEEVVKNKGINDPYFLTSFNQNIIPEIEKLTGIQSKIKEENFLDQSRNKLLSDLSINKLPLSSIYENGKMLGLGNSDIKQVTKKYIQDAADNGDINTVDKLTKEALEYADSKGFKPYVGEENEFGKLGLIALRNFGAKLEAEDRVRDTMLIKADNKEWQETIPLLMEETDPGKIDAYKRDWKQRMLTAGMSPEEVVKRERLIDSMLIPKEATIDQTLFAQKILLEFNSGRNPLGGNPLDTLEALRRDGKLTGKLSNEVFSALLRYKDKATTEVKADIKEARAQAKAEERINRENSRRLITDLRSSLFSVQNKVLNSLDDTLTPQIMGLGGNNKSASDLMKLYGASSLEDLQSKYIVKINEVAKETNQDKQIELYQKLHTEINQDYTNTGLVLNNVIPKFNKEYINNGKAESLYLDLNIAKKNGTSFKDWAINKKLTEKDLTALEVYAKNRNGFMAIKQQPKQVETKNTNTNTDKRIIKD